METKKIVNYQISIPNDRITSIKEKVKAYDWTQLPDAGGWNAGVGIADLKRLVNYWVTDYDWSKTEQRLNQLPQFITRIEGEPLHFIHVKGDSSKPPVLLLHGWPGSFLEFGTIPELLAANGHDVIVPSLPGFAFSNPITCVIGPKRAAQLMFALMEQLFSDTKFIVQGGDWGAHIACWMAYQQPGILLGIHINMVSIYAENNLPTTEEEKELFKRRDFILDWETGYNHQQETRPQTLGVAMADNPVGVAGWILEKFGKWADLPRLTDGSPDIWNKFTEQQLLDNIMLYIAPSAAVTATWIYHGKKLEGSDHFPADTHITVPTGVAAFPDPVFIPTPRSFVEKTYHVVHWSDLPSGGHFAAMEEPELFLKDFQAFIEKIHEGVQ